MDYGVGSHYTQFQLWCVFVCCSKFVSCHVNSSCVACWYVSVGRRRDCRRCQPDCRISSALQYHQFFVALHCCAVLCTCVKLCNYQCYFVNKSGNDKLFVHVQKTSPFIFLLQYFCLLSREVIWEFLYAFDSWKSICVAGQICCIFALVTGEDQVGLFFWNTLQLHRDLIFSRDNWR